MKRITDIPKERLSGMRVLIRVELNVDTGIELAKSDFRLRKAAQTITYLRTEGCRVVVCAHEGRDPKETLAPISQALKALVPHTFVRDVVGPEARLAAEAMLPGDVLLLENLRQHPGEVGNDPAFARALAEFGDIYVNDAFSVSHRAHASIVGVPEYLESYAGMLFCDEYENLSRALTPESPSIVVIGGAKFETKEPLIKKLLGLYDRVFVGGAIANDFLKARGFSVGRSLVSEGVPGADILNSPKLMIPPDVTVERLDKQARVKPAADVLPDDKIVDIGPEALQELVGVIQGARFILWNGPTGLYEDGYNEWTEALARAIAESSAHSIVGGGDTVATIATLNLEEKFTFLSTAGGAMLEFLTHGTLPGIEALERSAHIPSA